VSPLLAKDLTGLPPSLVIACECDPLYDEGMLFDERLQESGSYVEVVRLEGALHGVLSLMVLMPETTRRLFAALKSFLKTLP
jgi:acetyl esterase